MAIKPMQEEGQKRSRIVRDGSTGGRAGSSRTEAEALLSWSRAFVHGRMCSWVLTWSWEQITSKIFETVNSSEVEGEDN